VDRFAARVMEDDSGSSKRSKITPQQAATLMRFFEVQPLPDNDERMALAAKLDLTPRSVQVWFQNRRQRTKPGYAPSATSKAARALVTMLGRPPRGLAKASRDGAYKRLREVLAASSATATSVSDSMPNVPPTPPLFETFGPLSTVATAATAAPLASPPLELDVQPPRAVSFSAQQEQQQQGQQKEQQQQHLMMQPSQLQLQAPPSQLLAQLQPAATLPSAAEPSQVLYPMPPKLPMRTGLDWKQPRVFGPSGTVAHNHAWVPELPISTYHGSTALPLLPSYYSQPPPQNALAPATVAYGDALLQAHLIAARGAPTAEVDVRNSPRLLPSTWFRTFELTAPASFDLVTEPSEQQPVAPPPAVESVDLCRLNNECGAEHAGARRTLPASEGPHSADDAVLLLYSLSQHSSYATLPPSSP